MVRKAYGEPAILRLVLEETKPLRSPFVRGLALGGQVPSAFPQNCQGGGGCHPPCCLAAVGPVWTP